MKRNLLFLIALAGCFVQLSAQDKKSETFDSAFAHTVYFWFKNPDNQEDKAKFEHELKKFLDHSVYAKTNFIGTPPPATRDVVDGSFTYALIVTFESAEAQEGYQKEQPHLDFIAACKHMWEKVIVYDSNGISK